MSEEVKELVQKVIKGELPKEALPKPILIEDLGMMYPKEGSKERTRFGLYKCGFCGSDFKALLGNVKRGLTLSCGCYRKQVLTKHNLRNTKLYVIWRNMKNRTLNLNSKDYYRYGGRGITICDEWKDDVRAFWDWAMSNGYEENKGLSIDRIDNDGNYCPENCRWTTNTIQCRNQGLRKDNKSGFKGVWYSEDIEKFIVSIRISRVSIHLGYFQTAVEGAIVYNNYIIENNLEGFILNEIPQEYHNQNIREEDN